MATLAVVFVGFNFDCAHSNHEPADVFRSQKQLKKTRLNLALPTGATFRSPQSLILLTM